MQGSLRLHAGVLYVGRHTLTAEIATYDLDGRPLETRFQFRDEAAGRSTVDGIDLDADRRVWVADAAAERVHCFTLFGREVASVGDQDHAEARAGRVDRRGHIGAPVDVRVFGEDDDTALVVASAGERRYGLQVLHVASGRGRSIAPLGDTEGRFKRIRGLDLFGRELCVCEAGARRVQVFEGDVLGRLVFRFAFRIPDGLGDPEAVSIVGDGRIVVATGGDVSGVHVFDAAGRPIAELAGDEREAHRARSFGDGSVDQPCALALERTGHDRSARLCVLDADGERVQVLSLDGRSFGSILAAGAG